MQIEAKKEVKEDRIVTVRIEVLDLLEMPVMIQERGSLYIKHQLKGSQRNLVYQAYIKDQKKESLTDREAKKIHKPGASPQRLTQAITVKN